MRWCMELAVLEMRQLYLYPVRVLSKSQIAEPTHQDTISDLQELYKVRYSSEALNISAIIGKDITKIY